MSSLEALAKPKFHSTQFKLIQKEILKLEQELEWTKQLLIRKQVEEESLGVFQQSDELSDFVTTNSEIFKKLVEESEEFYHDFCTRDSLWSRILRKYRLTYEPLVLRIRDLYGVLVSYKSTIQLQESSKPKEKPIEKSIPRVPPLEIEQPQQSEDVKTISEVQETGSNIEESIEALVSPPTGPVKTMDSSIPTPVTAQEAEEKKSTSSNPFESFAFAKVKPPKSPLRNAGRFSNMWKSKSLEEQVKKLSNSEGSDLARSATDSIESTPAKLPSEITQSVPISSVYSQSTPSLTINPVINGVTESFEKFKEQTFSELKKSNSIRRQSSTNSLLEPTKKFKSLERPVLRSKISKESFKNEDLLTTSPTKKLTRSNLSVEAKLNELEQLSNSDSKSIEDHDTPIEITKAFDSKFLSQVENHEENLDKDESINTPIAKPSSIGHEILEDKSVSTLPPPVVDQQTKLQPPILVASDPELDKLLDEKEIISKPIGLKKGGLRRTKNFLFEKDDHDEHEDKEGNTVNGIVEGALKPFENLKSENNDIVSKKEDKIDETESEDQVIGKRDTLIEKCRTSSIVRPFSQSFMVSLAQGAETDTVVSPHQSIVLQPVNVHEFIKTSLLNLEKIQYNNLEMNDLNELLGKLLEYPETVKIFTNRQILTDCFNRILSCNVISPCTDESCRHTDLKNASDHYHLGLKCKQGNPYKFTFVFGRNWNELDQSYFNSIHPFVIHNGNCKCNPLGVYDQHSLSWGFLVCADCKSIFDHSKMECGCSKKDAEVTGVSNNKKRKAEIQISI